MSCGEYFCCLAQCFDNLHPNKQTALFSRWGYAKQAFALKAALCVLSLEGQQRLQQRIVIADVPPALL